MENKIKNKLYFYYKNYFGKYFRFSSYPYFTGDTLRNYAQHIYDETALMDPDQVMKKDKVFVKGDYLETYFHKIHPLIKNKYILFSHNSDEVIDSKYKQYIDKKIIHWFAQNLVDNFSNEVSLIPIGLENRWYFKNGRLNPIRKIKKIKQEKDILLLSLFNVGTNPERILINDIIGDNSQVVIPDRKNKLDYLSYIQRSKFNLCPEGNGPDTHRVWESLMLKSIPIMIKNNFSKQLTDYNIPILLIDDWDKLREVDKDKFNTFYENNSQKLETFNYVHFSYWENKFNQYLDV